MQPRNSTTNAKVSPRSSSRSLSNTSAVAPESDSSNPTNTSVPRFQWGTTPGSQRTLNSCFNDDANIISGNRDEDDSGRGKRRADTNDESKQDRRRIRRYEMDPIEPHIYADVHSKGLSSRIVQYQQETDARLLKQSKSHSLYRSSSQRLLGDGKSRTHDANRLRKTNDEQSMSLLQSPLSALYTAPYKQSAKRQIPVTRMSPPPKSNFYGHTLSSLLRSNSVGGGSCPSLPQSMTTSTHYALGSSPSFSMAVSRTEEELSHENRPILHPPPTENDLAPTRSVLDVLKEISRKRINSDDPDSDSDVTKKYCSRLSSGIDSSHVRAPPNITIGNNKRQREHFMSAINQSLATNNNNSTINNSFATRDSITQSPQSARRLQTTTVTATAGSESPSITNNNSSLSPNLSPEQQQSIAKKRLCSYNNDVSSSLSSSRYHANKRAFYGSRKSMSTGNIKPYEDTHTHAREEARSKASHVHFGDLTSPSLNCHTPITPIPPTPSGGGVPQSQPPVEIARTAFEPVELNNNNKNNNINQPKLTLFNKKVDNDNTGNRNQSPFSTTSLDEMSSVKIPFIKPKKYMCTHNSLMERVQKSKLAMMLCSLRGELYEGEEDDVEQQQRSDQMDGSNPKNLVTSVAIISPATTTTTTTTFSAAPSSGSNAVTTIVGLKFNPPPTPVSTVSGNIAIASNTKTQSTSTTSLQPVSPLVGLKLTPAAPNVSDVLTTPITTSTAPVSVVSFNFNQPNADQQISVASNNPLGNASSNDTNTMINKVPVLADFQFSGQTPTPKATESQPSSSSNTNNNNATATALSSFGGFSFPGGTTAAVLPTPINPINLTTTSNSPSSTVAAEKPIFTFGSTTPGQTKTDVANASPLITFSPNPIAADKSLNFTKDATVFGATINTTAETQPIVTKSITAAPTTSTFTFRVDTNGSATSAAPPTQQPSTFGSSTIPLVQASAPASKSDFSFTPKTTTGFSFGSTTNNNVNQNETKISGGGFAFNNVTTENNSAKSPQGGFAFNNVTTTTKDNNTMSPQGGFAFNNVTNTTTTENNIAKSPQGGFAFNHNVSTANTESIAAKSPHSGFAFNNNVTTANTESNAAKSPQGGFAFNNNNVTTVSNPIFGTSPATFSFSTSQNQEQQQKPAATSFSTVNSTSPFVFGGNAGPAAAAAPVGGGDQDNGKSTFNFGSGLSDTSKTGVVKPSFTFGSSGATKPFGFATSSTTNTNTALDGNNGSAPAKNNNTMSAANIFGAAIAAATSPMAPPTANVSRLFSFGSAVSENTEMNKPIAVTSPTNSFNFSNHNNFGDVSASTVNDNVAKSFTFGANLSGNNNNTINNNQSRHIFGANSPAPSIVPPSPSPNIFNFSAGNNCSPVATNVISNINNNSVTNVNPNGGNIFAQQQQPSGERVIRKATRRLQKP